VSALSLIAFLAVCAVIGLLAFGLLSKGSAAIEVGDPVPDRELPVLDGNGQKEIADYRGNWVLVNLWASWCGPCRQEAPVLDEFWKSHRRHHVVVLGINVQDNSNDALAFVREFHIRYPQLRSVGAERSEAFGATGVPENFLVDPRGRLKLIWRQPVDESILREQFLPVIEARS
jgi:cytochrome c biogenesis protein CcmG, thiol:disulfide interchange protein DsbE